MKQIKIIPLQQFIDEVLKTTGPKLAERTGRRYQNIHQAAKSGKYYVDPETGEPYSKRDDKIWKLKEAMEYFKKQRSK